MVRFRTGLRYAACAAFACFCACAAFLLPASSCLAYSFGPTVSPAGPEQTVFRWSTDACEPNDIPDEPARAFRDAYGRVQLISSHFVTRRMIGPDLNSVRHSCSLLLSSVKNADPAAFNDKVWLASPYTRNGRTVYGLLDDEYQGATHPNMCDPSYSGSAPLRCWYNAITFASSKNAGNSYQVAPLRGRLVASLPYPYQSGPGPYGYFSPSNIVFRPADSYYYVMISSLHAYGDQAQGACLLRTRTPGDPATWRAWDGIGFTVSFANPYANPGPATGHVCAPVSPDRIDTMTSSLTYNTYFGKYLLVGLHSFQNPRTGKAVTGFFYSLSSDLINWGPQRILMQATPPWSYKCGSEKPAYDPSLLDPNSTSRNFETSGQTVNLYFVRANFSFNSTTCWWSLDRDLEMIPIRFSTPSSPPPAGVAQTVAAPVGSNSATDSSAPSDSSPGG
jgi:hypothetical protein